MGDNKEQLADLKNNLAYIEAELKENVERNAQLHKDKMKVKRQLWELKGGE